MKFSKILLDDYMQTKEGKRVKAFFEGLPDAFNSRYDTSGFFEFMRSIATIDYTEYYFPFGDERFIDCAEGQYDSYEEFENAQRVMFEDEYEARNLQSYVHTFSIDRFIAYPEFAFPYLFMHDFHKVKIICEVLGIALPPVPGARWHSDRFNYYFDLCRAFYEFRKDHALTPVEMCVLVYGFAMRFLEDFITSAYGEPNRVYIVGATKWDVEDGVLKSPTESSVNVWQGSEEMLPGDIVIVYETSPYSRIRSIWRAVSPGFDDPFTYYPGAVYLGHPVMVPAVSIKELKSDPVWSKKGLVKASMQGVNGKVCTVDEYEALKKMFKRNDPKFDLSRVPTPPAYARFYHEELKVERDVEVQLLEPLLKKIGFSKWVRQLPLRMGRGDRVFPDYALGVKGSGDDAAADFIWEAKYRIPTAKQLKIDFGQAKSYGLRLQSKAVGLIAMEGVWYVTADDGFRFDKLRHFTWKQLQKPEAIAELRQAFS